MHILIGIYHYFNEYNSKYVFSLFLWICLRQHNLTNLLGPSDIQYSSKVSENIRVELWVARILCYDEALKF
jgi:hypothetical protein